MRKSQFTEEQIIGFLKQAEAGFAVAEICRKGGFSDATFYKWRAKFGGIEASDARLFLPLELGRSAAKRPCRIDRVGTGISATGRGRTPAPLLHQTPVPCTLGFD